MQFIVERLMGLFWIFIQQVCLCGLKWSYHDITLSKIKSRYFFILQGTAFIALVILCFGVEFSIPLLKPLYTEYVLFYPWTLRMILCSLMIFYDALIVLYFYRIFRIYEGKPLRETHTMVMDVAILFFVGSLFAVYTVLGVQAVIKYQLGFWGFVWIGRFFIQISNVFYILFEVGGAFLFWRFLKRIRQEREIL